MQNKFNRLPKSVVKEQDKTLDNSGFIMCTHDAYARVFDGIIASIIYHLHYTMADSYTMHFNDAGSNRHLEIKAKSCNINCDEFRIELRIVNGLVDVPDKKNDMIIRGLENRQGISVLDTGINAMYGYIAPMCEWIINKRGSFDICEEYKLVKVENRGKPYVKMKVKYQTI